MNDGKVIITVAVTGSIGDKSKHPNLPVTPKEIAESAVEAWSAGASVAHIHVRNPETSEPSMDFDLYGEVVERIRGASDMLVNLTTGAGARIIPADTDPVELGQGTMWRSPQKRTRHVVELKPEICSLDVGSINFGPRVFANVIPHIEEMAGAIKKAGVKPELEVFDLGHIEIAKALIKNDLVDGPPIFQLCLGIAWGIGAGTKSMLVMKEELPPDAVWGAFGVGRESFRMAAQAALLGGNIRVGFEDNFFLESDRPAQSNAQLVEKAVSILKALDLQPASPSEAREIFCLV
ncbi:3-keto-5-aminohexanoate cleavage protein [Thermodesulfobacteriota bacterium]